MIDNSDTIQPADIKPTDTQLINNELLAESGVYRFSKSRLPKDYVANKKITNKNQLAYQGSIEQGAPRMVGWQAIASDELVSEFMLNALRLHDGVTWTLFEARTNLKYSHISAQVNKLVSQGLLIESQEKLQPTALGSRYLNRILRDFL